MKTPLPRSVRYTFQPETIAALSHLRDTCPGTVAEHDAFVGAAAAEPVLIMMDSAIRWIKAYAARFDQTVSDDCMATPEISGILSGIRGLLNFDGGAAMESGARDSKDNGVIESLFWTACKLAGIDGNDI